MIEEMAKHHVALSSYHFQRAKTQGIINVLNEGSYIMAEYSERTGTVKWQRVVLATQKEMIEKWLGQHYPAHAAPEPPPVEKRRKPLPVVRARAARAARAK